jgi:hypothetical protein
LTAIAVCSNVASLLIHGSLMIFELHMQSDNKSVDNYHKLSEQEIQSEINRLEGWTIEMAN